MLKRIFNNCINDRLVGESNLINKAQMADSYYSVYFKGGEKSYLRPELYKYLDVEAPFFLSDFSTKQTFKAPFYSIVENACLCGFYATAITENGKILTETTCGSRGYLRKGGDSKYILGYKFFNTELVVEYAFSLVNILSKAYFHWVAEVLPTLEAYFEFQKLTGIRPKLIVDYPLSSFQFEYLELLGFREDDIVYWRYKKVRVKNLIIASLRYNRVTIDDYWAYHIFSKEGFDWLRNILFNNIGVNIKETFDKLLVDRADAKGRRIINQKILGASLKKNGFKNMVVSDLSVKDQIRLFSGLKYLIAPHGAG